MNRFLCLLLVVSLSLLSVGCVGQAAKDQAAQNSSAHDQYATLVTQTFDGTIKPEDGQPVTAADLAATPASVRDLLGNAIRALYLSRASWHALAYALDVGPDPKTLQLAPPAFPGGIAATSSSSK